MYRTNNVLYIPLKFANITINTIKYICYKGLYFRMRKLLWKMLLPNTVIFQKTTKKLNSDCDSECLYLNKFKYTQTLKKII
jgi:hypothetical protein